MNVQVLIATMNQVDHSLLDKMNIQTDAIVGNQCDRDSVEKFEYKGHRVSYYNFDERGVGLNRNNTLMRATGDVCLFADDDMVYRDGYDKEISDIFEKNRDAAVVVFNIIGRKQIKRMSRVWYFNFLRYGTARMAVRLSKIREKGIYFNQCFGGGTEHSHGEDNLFLGDCLKAGLKVYAVPVVLAELTDSRQSSWDNGNKEKYILDQGVLFRTLSRRWWRLLCFQDSLRRHNKYGYSFISCFKMMIGSNNRTGA